MVVIPHHLIKIDVVNILHAQNHDVPQKQKINRMAF